MICLPRDQLGKDFSKGAFDRIGRAFVKRLVAKSIVKGGNIGFSTEAL